VHVDCTPPGLDAEIVSLVGVYDFARMNQVLIIYHVRSKNAAQPIVLDPKEIAAHRLVAPHRLQPWQVQNGAPLSAQRGWDFTQDTRFGNGGTSVRQNNGAALLFDSRPIARITNR
jgi:hypothetical protein